MQWRQNQIALVKEVRAKLGLGLREAYDLTNQYPNKTAEEIAAIVKGGMVAEICDVSTSINPSVLTPAERDMIAALRARGFAVTLFNPCELAKASARDIEACMVESGNEAIGFANASE